MNLGPGVGVAFAHDVVVAELVSLVYAIACHHARRHSGSARQQCEGRREILAVPLPVVLQELQNRVGARWIPRSGAIARVSLEAQRVDVVRLEPALQGQHTFPGRRRALRPGRSHGFERGPQGAGQMRIRRSGCGGCENPRAPQSQARPLWRLVAHRASDPVGVDPHAAGRQLDEPRVERQEEAIVLPARVTNESGPRVRPFLDRGIALDTLGKHPHLLDAFARQPLGVDVIAVDAAPQPFPHLAFHTHHDLVRVEHALQRAQGHGPVVKADLELIVQHLQRPDARAVVEPGD